ncbi:hypothetical protein F4553_000470 [Allocatelliglobosispora scoriae]|uniref:DUF4034 domain-containing protein n=1 Tax=Allocatelliglobosispora scoriae TaxID=643052 RepID=A0A841BJL7_9ACTN|nr:hypothetical protein [Allocatelliglobosispora scoriae]MBB5867091.1 hypothetical protein [Allocatelliglobosispora scoriae]
MSLPSDMNLAWADPALQRAAVALADGAPGQARDLLAATTDPDRRELYVSVLGDAGRHQLKALRELASDAGDDPHALLLLGSALGFAAWAARGAATMDHTAEDQVQGMLGFAAQSRTMLGRAAALAPDDPAPLVALMSVVKAAATDRHEPHRLFKQVDALAPDSFMGNQQRLSMLCRKWYGSTEQMLGFTRERVALLPDGHPLLSLVPQAHIEVWVDGWMEGNFAGRIYRRFTYGPLKRAAVRDEVDRASDRMLAGAAAFADHPWAMMAHQMFGAYYAHAGAKAKARVHLERGGDRASEWPWGYFGDASVELQNARSAAGL